MESLDGRVGASDSVVGDVTDAWSSKSSMFAPLSKPLTRSCDKLVSYACAAGPVERPYISSTTLFQPGGDVGGWCEGISRADALMLLASFTLSISDKYEPDRGTCS